MRKGEKKGRRNRVTKIINLNRVYISTTINIKSFSQHFIDLINFLLGKIEECMLAYYIEVWADLAWTLMEILPRWPWLLVSDTFQFKVLLVTMWELF